MIYMCVCVCLYVYVHIHINIYIHMLHLFYKSLFLTGFFPFKIGFSTYTCGCMQIKWINSVFKSSICKYNIKLQNTTVHYLVKCTSHSYIWILIVIEINSYHTHA